MRRHRPSVVTARLSGRDHLVAPGLVVPEHAGVEVAERPLHCTGQGGEVDEVGRALLPRVPERVRQHQPPLGVGVRDLDRLAVHRREDVAGAVRAAADHVLRRADDAEHSNRHAEFRERADALDHRRTARHVALHVLHVVGRLQRDAAGVERDRLAHEPEHESVALAGRVVAKDDQTRRVVAALGNPDERAHPEPANLVQAERLVCERLVLGGDLGGTVCEALRREVVRRPVGEVAGAVRPLRNALRALG